MEPNNFEHSFQSKASLHQTDYKNRTQLLQAICNKNVKEIKELLKQTHINFINQKKETLVHTALLSAAGVQIVQELLHHGADASALDNDGNSPLHMCFDDVTVELACVEALLKHGAKVNLAGHRNQTPLHRAVFEKTEIGKIKALLCHEADVNAVDKDNNTPLHLCFEHGVYVECAKELLKYEVDVKVTNSFDQTPLQMAISSDADIEIVKAILHHGADINAVDRHGDSVLFCAVERDPGTWNCVAELLKCGAEVNATNHLKETPLFGAVMWSNAEIVEELLAHGANPNVSDSVGETPLNLAMDTVDSTQIAKLLVKYSFVGDFFNLFDLSAYRHSENYGIVERYFKECASELVQMKTMKVDDRFSLDVFFTTKILIIHLCSDSKNTEEEHIVANYPIYSDLLLPRVNYALERGMLLGKIKEVYHGSHFRLNYDCVYVIIKHLSNDNLCNLILALYNCDPNN